MANTDKGDCAVDHTGDSHDDDNEQNEQTEREAVQKNQFDLNEWEDDATVCKFCSSARIVY